MTENKVDAEKLANVAIKGSLVSVLTGEHGFTREQAEKLIEENQDQVDSYVRAMANRIAMLSRDTPPTKSDERAVRS